MSETSRVLRWEVPIDDRDHPHDLDASPFPILEAVLSDGYACLSFWTHSHNGPRLRRWFRAFGTGQPIPANYEYRATAPRARGLVFHLFERVSG